MKKIIISTFMVMVMLLVSNIAIAQTEIDTSVQDSADAGVTPDSPWWGLDLAFEKLTMLLTAGTSAKAKLGLEHAQERLAEVKVMIAEKRLEAASRSRDEHRRTLIEVRKNIRGIHGDTAIREIEDVLDIEQELEHHDDEVNKTFDGLKVRMKIRGNVTDAQQAQIDAILESLQGQNGEVRIEIKNKKDEIKIRIKVETGKSEQEIEIDVENLKEEARDRSRISHEDDDNDKIELESEDDDDAARVGTKLPTQSVQNPYIKRGSY